MDKELEDKIKHLKAESALKTKTPCTAQNIVPVGIVVNNQRIVKH